MASISLANISKRFGSLSVLDNVSIDIRDREFVALVGPSGCGKSTLLRIVAGLESISDGEISIDGEVVNDLGPQKRDLAMVFQTYALYPHMTTAQNMAFPLKLRGHSALEIDKAVGQAASTLHLDDLMDRLPRALSGGQRQRVAMGRAMVREPRAFLFDEPLSNLDAKLRSHMRLEIRQLHQALNATSIYVTHDQVEAMTMADRIVVMNRGRVEQEGSPIELFDRPANLFVASFLGSPTMNMADAVLTTDDEGKPVLSFDAQTSRIPVPAFTGAPNRKVIAGLRPQHMDVVPPDEGMIQAQVQIVENTGCETNIVVAIGAETWTVQSRQRQRLAQGDVIGLIFREEHIHLFDHGSQKRIN
ncbi:ABC transporter ATP-binding protein [Kaistia granuli]|uniref:ABC transporter ATP-binding protein n=1 Tax=Kaistia granuli TaxID=363259 RepID=UPI00036C7E95|nr:sn-glycerol-3-phosphate ABC transporter ATP-binding protein UgpC [Kaistia granuli]